MAAILRRSPDRVIAELAREVAAADPGAEPALPDPDIPVIQVTGTNGKTTTTRLIAHMVMTAGKRVAFSSTVPTASRMRSGSCSRAWSAGPSEAGSSRGGEATSCSISDRLCSTSRMRTQTRAFTSPSASTGTVKDSASYGA